MFWIPYLHGNPISYSWHVYLFFSIHVFSNIVQVTISELKHPAATLSNNYIRLRVSTEYVFEETRRPSSVLLLK